MINVTTNKILFLRNLNDEEPEKWQKFWKSFNAWFESDALNKNFIKDEYIYYNSGWYGGTYELNIDMEQEYNIEYGESYPGFNMYVDYESIKKFVEIAFSRWIKKEQRYAYTIKVNELLKKFNLSYRLNKGKLARIGDQDLESISKVNDIKLNKGDRLYSAFETYTISEFIAQGGNGKVYKAEDSRNRIIAIKVVLREQGSKLARFSNEINFCERNQNRNIIEIYDHGTIGNNMIFYVMPLAKETLRDRIKKHIQHSDAEEIFINILYGLKYAHEKGAYHRDIKPENILFLDETNNAVIADFGIAHFCEEDIIASVKTKASDRMANFQYAAPEQKIKGNAKNVDGRADVYAAGLILVEMFTGELVGAGNYTKISKVAPEYKYLDDVFNELFCQNPNDRLYPVDAIIEKINSYRSKENSDGSN